MGAQMDKLLKVLAIIAICIAAYFVAWIVFKVVIFLVAVLALWYLVNKLRGSSKE